MKLIDYSMEEKLHYPVMHKEVYNYLFISEGVFVDCTVGIGSHACYFLEKVGSRVIYIGIDKDSDSLKIAEERLKIFGTQVQFFKSNFSNLDIILKELGLKEADVFFFDLGISTYQLSCQERGFSFLKEGLLDMRMDKESYISAYDLVNNLSRNELFAIFKKFGEERYAKRIADKIVEERRKHPIKTTIQLANLIKEAVPLYYHYGRIHPATRCFQALRIMVNRELEELEIALKKAVFLLKKGGRIGVISFHSLEDRIVKNTFRKYAYEKKLKIITPKPLIPTEEEIKENFSSRSAKFRVAEKI